MVEGALKHCDTVIVIDDCSEDLTADLSLRSGARVITHILHLGTGAALFTGFKAALGMDANVFGTMDGDGQHDPTDIPNLLEPIRNDEADIVIGSRLLGRRGSMPLHKWIGNKVLSRATSLASGVCVRDSQSGFRAYKRTVLDFAMHRRRDYGWASEILILTAKGNFRMREVPVRTIYTVRKKKGARIEDGFKILYTVIRPKSSARQTMNPGEI